MWWTTKKIHTHYRVQQYQTQAMMAKNATHPAATYSPQLRSKWVAIFPHSRNRWDIYDACDVCYRLSCKVKFVHCKYIHNQVRKQTTVTYHITKWPHGTTTMLQSATLQITHWWMEGQGVNKNNMGKLNHTLKCFGKQPILHDRPFRLFLLPSLLWYGSCTPRNMLLLKNSA